MNTVIISSLLFIGAALVITYWPTVYLVIRHYVDDKDYCAFIANKKRLIVNDDRTAFNGNWYPVVVAIAVLFVFTLLLVL